MRYLCEVEIEEREGMTVWFTDKPTPASLLRIYGPTITVEVALPTEMVNFMRAAIADAPAVR